jgi:hypothetical protein
MFLMRHRTIRDHKAAPGGKDFIAFISECQRIGVHRL